MLYDIAFLMFSVFYLPALIFKGKLHRDFAERFGSYGGNRTRALSAVKGCIWIQAVSVGEVSLCRTLISSLRAKYPDLAIVLSTITKTGNDLAKKIFSKDAIIIYFPLDLSFIVRKAVDAIKPRIYIMIETEIWPNLLRELFRRSVPAVMLNGRISDRSYGGYKAARPFLRRILEGISAFCMQSRDDAERIIALGAPKDKVTVTGNMKFDTDIAGSDLTAQIRSMLSIGPEDRLFVAGSTHEGEEEILISVFREISPEFPRLKILIAPRHIERLDRVEEIAKRFGYEPMRVSRIRTLRFGAQGAEVLLLDTIGQLKEIYAVSSIVFVGGSLIRHGGQNPIEPAIFGKPILFGPHMFNFKDIACALLKNRAAMRVANRNDLIFSLKLLLSNKEKARELGSNAMRVVTENRGATERSIAQIEKII